MHCPERKTSEKTYNSNGLKAKKVTFAVYFNFACTLPWYVLSFENIKKV